MKTLLKFAANVYSQNGEDGVLAEVLKRLGIKSGWCVEFGAWDGKYLSNTYALVEQGWRAVYIEGNGERLKALEPRPNILAIEAYVSPYRDSSERLDNLLQGTPVPADFDLLSIDVDSIDWWIWNSLENYRPKAVVIEINGMYPPGVRYVQPLDLPPFASTEERKLHGASFTSMKELGNQKGYSLVGSTGNMIFVRDDLVPRLDLPETEINSDGLFVDAWLPKPLWKRILNRIKRLTVKWLPMS